MSKKARRKSSFPEGEAQLLELLKKIYVIETPMETRKKEAAEPLYLIRYE